MKLAIAVLLLGACVAEEATAPSDHLGESVIDVELVQEQHDESGVCAAAAALPETELCSLVCDPDAFKARLLDGGMKAGNCYQVRCTLSADMSVTVGVCLL